MNTLHGEIVVAAGDGIEDQVKAIVKESVEGAFRKIFHILLIFAIGKHVELCLRYRTWNTQLY